MRQWDLLEKWASKPRQTKMLNLSWPQSPPATQWSWNLQMPTTGLTTWASTPCCGKCDNTGQVGHALPTTCSNMNAACFYSALSEPTSNPPQPWRSYAWLHLRFDHVQDLTPHVGQTPRLWRLNCPPTLVGGRLPTVPTPLPERAQHWLLPFTCQELDHFPLHNRARSKARHPWSQPTRQRLSWTEIRWHVHWLSCKKKHWLSLSLPTGYLALYALWLPADFPIWHT